ncbi:MAG: ATP-dependent Clp protease proteolytic subunit, partial [Candidatus Aminicenantaceae bacterium]
MKKSKRISHLPKERYAKNVENVKGAFVMLEKILLATIFLILLMGCASMNRGAPPPREIIVKVQAVPRPPYEPQGEAGGDPAKAQVNNGNGADIHKSMEVPNQEGSLSNMSFIVKDEAFIKIFSSLTVGDVTRLWNDIWVLKMSTNIRKVNLFINSPGGDAFSGLALADQIERAKKEGFHITAHASGIVASAAVPVFAVSNRRLAAPGTIFMIHETSVWKWPGRETASDIRSQNKLMNLIRDRYIG